MKKVDIKTLNDNFIEAIGKEWMLIASGNRDHFNVMTASWGCVGWLWNKPVAVIFVRPERFTHDFIEDNAVVTLSFLGKDPDMRSIYNLCGSKSGRECDKVKATGLMPVYTECGSVTFKQARLTLECEKLYKDNIKPECFLNPEISKWYGGSHGGYHDAYILEIKNVYVSQ